MFLNRLPKWIRLFPSELDKAALTQLAKSSEKSVEAPREMNFSLYNFTKGPELEAALDQISSAGWKCTTQQQADAKDRIVLTATKSDYVLTEVSYKQDIVFFRRIAKLYGAEYDGWFASN